MTSIHIRAEYQYLYNNAKKKFLDFFKNILQFRTQHCVIVTMENCINLYKHYKEIFALLLRTLGPIKHKSYFFLNCLLKRDTEVVMRYYIFTKCPNIRIYFLQYVCQCYFR